MDISTQIKRNESISEVSFRTNIQVQTNLKGENLLQPKENNINTNKDNILLKNIAANISAESSITSDSILKKKQMKKQIKDGFSMTQKHFLQRRTFSYQLFNDPLDGIESEEREIRSKTEEEEAQKNFYVTNSPIKNFKIKITEFRDAMELSVLYYDNPSANLTALHGYPTALTVNHILS